MNVLILTPDRVGSTLLQRLITIYMVSHEFDKPVINLHELTNGLMKYYSPTFNQEVLGKDSDISKWGYYQSLSVITELLKSTDHYKTARLAKYHINSRHDKIDQQVPFYQYLNDNFFIISAKRDNLLEHALSWCISVESKRLNVFSHQEKVDVFSAIYNNKITVSPENLVKYLKRYVDYLSWVDNHFTVNSYFYYDRDLPRIEEYILDLPIFNNQAVKKTWKDTFDIEFKDWNKVHYLGSDLSGIGGQLDADTKQLTFEENNKLLELQPVTTTQKIAQSLSLMDQKFLIQHMPTYHKTSKAISELIDHKILINGIPIKLQTMLEKKLLIKNFKECVEVYNSWVTKNGVGNLYTETDIKENIEKEISQWHSTLLLK